MKETNPMTREQWLLEMTQKLRPMFDAAGASIPAKVRVTCGWTSRKALSPTSRRIGECWSPECSGDKSHEIFISPVLDNAARVAGVLLHELIHATVGNEHGHKGPFRALAVKLGLEGKMTSTTESEELTRKLQAFAGEIGPYPHAKLDGSNRKKQSTRLIKVVCPDCGYTIRTTEKWIEQGLPTCACGSDMEEA